MPYDTVWRNPEIALRWKGVTVYHHYQDDDINNGPSWFDFTTNQEGSGADGGEDPGFFDVRGLSTWIEPAHPPYLDRPENDTPENRKGWDVYHGTTEPGAVRTAIRHAIERGIVTQNGAVLSSRDGGLSVPGA